MSLDDDSYKNNLDVTSEAIILDDRLHDSLLEVILKNDLDEFIRISTEASFDWNHVQNLPSLMTNILENRRWDILRMLLSHPKLKSLSSVPTELWFPIVELGVPEWIIYLLRSELDFWQVDKELLACSVLDIPNLTVELYKWSLPPSLGPCEAIQRKLVENEFLPPKFLEYVVNETDLDLGPVQIMVPDLNALQEEADANRLYSMGRMSYVAYASLLGNHAFREVLMTSPRYLSYISSMNTKIDVSVRQKLAAHSREYQKITGQAVRNFF